MHDSCKKYNSPNRQVRERLTDRTLGLTFPIHTKGSYGNKEVKNVKRNIITDNGGDILKAYTPRISMTLNRYRPLWPCSSLLSFGLRAFMPTEVIAHSLSKRQNMIGGLTLRLPLPTIPERNRVILRLMLWLRDGHVAWRFPLFWVFRDKWTWCNFAVAKLIKCNEENSNILWLHRWQLRAYRD